ncbi:MULTISPECIES: hypothetical protein [unclassified Ruegeria]|uniref:hypothetical protein n=1 Tax=Ruegeria sp. HKCCSP351 TaxID=2794832 RepID=UPI001AE5F6A9|nr:MULTISPECIES: hypothetical protein [unclassified Ruegeria]MCX8953877.1 hypothetical protein [Ruegeria sp. NA]
MDDWLTAYKDWWKQKASGHPLLWCLCLFLAMFVTPTFVLWVWKSQPVAVLIAFVASALLFLPGILIAGFELLRPAVFQMRDRIQREKTQDLINKRNCGFWKWW